MAGRISPVNDSQAQQKAAAASDVNPNVSNWNLPNVLTSLRILLSQSLHGLSWRTMSGGRLAYLWL